ncbi:MAG: hypothetical protein Q8L48_39085 [Archangium sp.]|nr:hypothetical protein [Archangium sp.]
MTIPLSTLARYASAGATGELIAVGDGLEVHVFLQAGRIAWGTTTAERFVFRRHLTSAFQVDEQALQAALAEGQRSRRPLGETLVARGILTLDQVREGLRAQVVSALASLERCAGGQTLFLPRGANYATFDASLTFELGDLAPQRATPLPTQEADEALAQLSAAVPELTWAAALSGREVLASVRGAPPAAVLELGNRLTPGTDLLAVRASGGNLVGGMIRGSDRSLWCGLPEEASITSALWAIAGAAERPHAPAEPGCARGQFEAFGESSHSTEGVQEILERAICPVGVVVLDRSGTPDLWALARGPLDPAELAQVATQRQRVLDADVYATRPRRGRGTAALAFQSVLVGDSRWWWFGADLVTTEVASIWLALPRNASQGLGWALLATLSRHLSTPERADD